MCRLRFVTEEIVWQEVPGEVTLAFLFSGCPLRCKGCHSADAWKAGTGTVLTEDYLKGRDLCKTLRQQTAGTFFIMFRLFLRKK